MAAASPVFSAQCRLERRHGKRSTQTHKLPPPSSGTLIVRRDDATGGRMELFAPEDTQGVGAAEFVLMAKGLASATIFTSKTRPSMMLELQDGEQVVLTILHSDAATATQQRDKANACIKQVAAAYQAIAARSGDAPVLKGHRNRPGGQIIPQTAARAPVPGSDTSSDEAAIRRRVLSTDAALCNLYAQLVATGVVSEEEFWRQRKQALLDEEARRPGAGYSAFVDDADDDERVPKVTLSKVSYTLTEWDIEKIFRESPAVFAAYLQEVPARMTEQEFWTKYLRSKYFHRHRATHDLDPSTREYAERGEFDAVFQKYEPKAEELAKSRRKLAESIVDPRVDLIRTAEESLRWRPACTHGYGTTDATTVYEPEPLSKARLQAQQGHKPNKDGRAIARKRERLQEDTTSTIYQTNRFSEHVVKRAQPLQTGALMQSPPVLPDALVRTDSLQDLEGEEGSGMIPLTLKDQTRYFEHGGKVDEAAGTERDASSLAATEAMAASVEVLASASELRLPPRRDASVVLAYTARAMAGAGTGASVDGAGTSAGREAPTGEAAESCAQMHAVNAELLRHFWTAMRTPGAQQRVKKIVAMLRERLSAVEAMETAGPQAQALARVRVALVAPLRTAIGRYETVLKDNAERKRAKRQREAANGGAGNARGGKKPRPQ